MSFTNKFNSSSPIIDVSHFPNSKEGLERALMAFEDNSSHLTNWNLRPIKEIEYFFSPHENHDATNVKFNQLSNRLYYSRFGKFFRFNIFGPVVDNIFHLDRSIYFLFKRSYDALYDIPYYRFIVHPVVKFGKPFTITPGIFMLNMLKDVGLYACDTSKASIKKRVAEHILTKPFDVYSKWAQSILLHSYMLSRSKDLTDLILNVLAFLDANTTTPLVTFDRSQHLLKKAKKICMMFFSGYDNDDNLDLQSLFEDLDITNIGDKIASGMGQTRTKIKDYDRFKHSKIYQKMHKLCMYLMCVSVCEKFGIQISDWGFSQLEEKAMRRKFHLTPDFLVCLVDTFIFVCETGVQCFKLGSLEPIFHSDSAYLMWYEKTLDLGRRRLTLTSAQDSSVLINFLGELDATIEKGESIYKYAETTAEKKGVLTNLNSLKIIRDELMNTTSSAQMREAPFSILLFGDSGIGKSSILNMLYHHFAKLRGLDNDDKFRYTINPIAKYWDNFHSYQWAIVLDDIASLRPDKCAELEPSLNQVLMVNNIIPYTPDQAALEKKGKTPLKAKFVIATTNTKDLSANSFFNCPSAIQRRFPFIVTPVLRQEYATDGRLDASKCKNLTDYPDFWNFTVEKVLTRPVVGRDIGATRNCDYEVVLDNVGLPTFLTWFNHTVKVHFENQSVTTLNNSLAKDIELCGCCSLPPSCCVENRILSSPYGEKFSEPEFDGFSEQALHMHTNRRIKQAYWWFWLFLEYIYIHQDGFMIFLVLLMVYACRSSLWFYIVCFLFVKLNSLNFQQAVENLSIRQRIYRKYILFKMEHNPSIVVRRKFYQMLGSRALTTMRYPKALLGISSVIGSIFLIRKFFDEKKDDFSTQGDIVSSLGNRPVATDKEVENPWKKDNYTLSTFDVSPESCSWKALRKEKLLTLIRNNLVRIAIKTPEGTFRHTNGVCITQQIYVFNLHTFRDLDRAEVIVSATDDMEGVGDKAKVIFDRKCFLIFEESDLFFVHIANLPPRKDLTKFFCKETNNVSAHGFYIGRDAKYGLQFNDAKFINLNMVDRVPFTKQMCWTGITEKLTVKGDCGSLLVLTTHFGPVFAGLHTLGSESKNIIATRLTFELLRDKVLPHFAENMQCGEPELSAPSKTRFLKDLNGKSPIRYITNGCASVYGSFADVTSAKKSMVQKTIFYKDLLLKGFEDKYTAPQLSGWKPQRAALLELTDTATTFDPLVLTQAYQSFIQDILISLDPKEFNLIEKYDVFTAVNGAAGIAYVDKMNRQTSMGCPWKTTKKKFFDMIPEEDNLQEPVEFNAEVMHRVESMRTKYIFGERCQPVFCAHLKDEPVSFEKARLGKTRVFMGAPADFSILVRQYFLSSVRVIQRNRFVFEAAPGTNACSKEWDDFYQYLIHFGKDRMVAGDFKKFDKRMPANFMLAAFDILITLARHSGNFCEDDLRVMKGIAYDISFPVCDYFGSLMMFYGSNPSGHPLTVIINCLVNSLYMRYCYILSNPLRECFTFKENVHLLTYGDDNVMGVSIKTPWFNHTSIQKTLSVCGVDYTMADKSEGSIPYIDISEVTFLKRYWKTLRDIPFKVGPLELSSIEKSLMTWTRSKSITAEEQMLAIVSSAMQSYALWGATKYKLMATLLERLCRAHRLDLISDLDKIIPPYDVMLYNIFGEDYRAKVELSNLNQNLIANDSDCLFQENSLLLENQECGSLDEVRLGVPQSPFLGKITSLADTCFGDEIFPFELSRSVERDKDSRK